MISMAFDYYFTSGNVYINVRVEFFKTSYYTFWPYMMAATIIMTIPMIIIFLSFQNQFVETGRAAAVKG